jgi:osmotically-inducible protein OsmY
MSNDDLKRTVTDELSWDPKIDDAGIVVTADDGAITLRGTVGSFKQKREAKKDAESVYGVKSVENELEVKLLTEHRRADAELRAAVLQALTLDSDVPPTVDADVVDSWVTLTGTVTWRFQFDEAESVASKIQGVVAVDNAIVIVPPAPPPPSTEDLQHSIKEAMKRNAKLDAKNVSVKSSEGTVTLSGTVRSWADHDAALNAAWAAPGVSDVQDRIHVAY